MKKIFFVLAIASTMLTGCVGTATKAFNNTKNFGVDMWETISQKEEKEAIAAFNQAANEIQLLAANGSPAAKKVVAICGGEINLKEVNYNQNKNCLNAVFAYPDKLKGAKSLWEKHGENFSGLEKYKYRIIQFAFPSDENAKNANAESNLQKALEEAEKAKKALAS